MKQTGVNCAAVRHLEVVNTGAEMKVNAISSIKTVFNYFINKETA